MKVPRTSTFGQTVPTYGSLVSKRVRAAWPLVCGVVIFVLSVVPSPVWPGAHRQFFSSVAVRAPYEWLDVVANVALYLPLGFTLCAAGVRRSRAVLVGLALSTLAELLQFVVPGRDPSLRDILTNTTGTWTGAYAAGSVTGRHVTTALVKVEQWLAERLDPRDSRADRTCVGYAVLLAAIATATVALLMPWAPRDRQYVVANATIDSVPGPVVVGASRDADGTFKGLVDDIRIYAAARSETAIGQDSQTSASRPPIGDSSLVAAFAFDDEPPGGGATDSSGKQHHGVLEGATIVQEGRHGSGLALDGTSRMVVPNARSLGIRDAVTLEAWIYLDEEAGVEAPIIAQDAGVYHLVVSSATGVRRLVGGGVFGGSPSTTRSVEPVLPRRWTHVAMTYDGESIRVFINGRLDVTRRRWSPHRPQQIWLNGRDLPFGNVALDRHIAPALLRPFVLKVNVACGKIEAAGAPLFLLTSARNIDPLTLVARGPDILVRTWTIGRALGLLSPDYRFEGALVGCSQGRDIALQVSGSLKRPQLAVDGRVIAGGGLGIASTWALFIHSELLAGWLRDACSVCWLAMLLVPFGYCVRRSVAGAFAAAIVVTALAGVPVLVGIDPLSRGQIVGAGGGILAGVLAVHARRAARPLRAAAENHRLNRLEDDEQVQTE